MNNAEVDLYKKSRRDLLAWKVMEVSYIYPIRCCVQFIDCQRHRSHNKSCISDVILNGYRIWEIYQHVVIRMKCGIQYCTACYSVFILQIALNEISSVRFLVPVYTTKAQPAPISQKLKPTIMIFIKVEIVDGVNNYR